MKQLLRLRPAASNILRSIEKTQPRQLCGTRSFCNSSSRLQEKEEEGKPSFRGQLYESTADRLQRERADQARYIKQTDARNPNEGKTLATSFGKDSYIPIHRHR
jgi:D-lactate dehydrogenase (cytochrome)